MTRLWSLAAAARGHRDGHVTGRPAIMIRRRLPQKSFLSANSVPRRYEVTPCHGMAEPAQAGRAGDQLEAVRKSLDFRTASSWPPALTFFSVLSLLVTTMYPGWTNPTVHGTQYSTLARCLLPVMSPAPPRDGCFLSLPRRDGRRCT